MSQTNTSRIHLSTISSVILHQSQLRQLDVLINHQRNIGIPLKNHIIGCMGHYQQKNSVEITPQPILKPHSFPSAACTPAYHAGRS